MAGQYQQKIVNKQYNSPIQLYSDRNVRQVLEKETKILSNGAIGIDFNSPLSNKPANLQNSAVLRMLEEEESRRRNGQPGSIENSSKPLRDQIVWPPEPNVIRHTTLADVPLSGLKRVAWPPAFNSELEGYVEQEAVQSQGGPLFSSKTEPDPQNNQAPLQQTPTSPVYQQQQRQQQQQQPQPKSPVTTNNTFQPITSPFSASSLSAAPSPYQSAPLSPNINKSPVSFVSLAKPWSPAPSSPQYKPVQRLLTTVESYQSSKLYQYQSQEQIRETQSVVLPPYTPAYQSSTQETTFQQYQTPAPVERQHSVKVTAEEKRAAPQSSFSDFKQSEIPEKQPQSATNSFNLKPSLPTQIQQELPKAQSLNQESSAVKPIVKPSQPAPLKQLVTLPVQSQPTAAAKGIAQNQAPAPAPQRYQQPQKQVEPPPSTITLRPQAPVSQAPSPLVSSQPATATLRGGKNLRGDMKWPPENVRERMAAEEQHLEDLSRGPACKPRKNCKDYSGFFAKHALNSVYPGYKIPPGTQFYDHNPVM